MDHQVRRGRPPVNWILSFPDVLGILDCLVHHHPLPRVKAQGRLLQLLKVRHIDLPVDGTSFLLLLLSRIEVFVVWVVHLPTFEFVLFLLDSSIQLCCRLLQIQLVDCLHILSRLFHILKVLHHLVLHPEDLVLPSLVSFKDLFISQVIHLLAAVGVVHGQLLQEELCLVSLPLVLHEPQHSRALTLFHEGQLSRERILDLDPVGQQ